MEICAGYDASSGRRRQARNQRTQACDVLFRCMRRTPLFKGGSDGIVWKKESNANERKVVETSIVIIRRRQWPITNLGPASGLFQQFVDRYATDAYGPLVVSPVRFDKNVLAC